MLIAFTRKPIVPYVVSLNDEASKDLPLNKPEAATNFDCTYYEVPLWKNLGHVGTVYDAAVETTAYRRFAVQLAGFGEHI